MTPTTRKQRAIGAWCLVVCIACVIAAYPLLAVTSDVFDLGATRNASIALRVLVGLAAVLALWFGRDSFRLAPGPFLGAALLFWLAYFYRFAYEAWLDETLAHQTSVTDALFVWALFVMVPAAGALLGLDRESAARAFRYTLAMTVLTAAMLCWQSADMLLVLVKSGAGRIALDKLNAISLGSVGCVLIILAVAGAGSWRGARKALPLVALGVVAAVLAGVFLLIVSGSRGPALALALTMALYWLYPLRALKFVVGLAMIVALGWAVAEMLQLILDEFGLDFAKRYRDAAEGDSASVEIRKRSFEGAWHQFLESPFIGSSLLERRTGFYPHNLVLEAFMVTGLVGGLSYLLCLAYLLRGIGVLLRRSPSHAWLAALAFYALVSTQSSGTHIQHGLHWVTLVCVVMSAEALTRRAPSRPERDFATLGKGRRRRRRARSEGRAAGTAGAAAASARRAYPGALDVRAVLMRDVRQAMVADPDSIDVRLDPDGALDERPRAVRARTVRGD